MKKTKHTNGPWLISTIDGEDCLMVGSGDGSEVVADIRLGRITGLATNGEALSEGPSHEEAMANAHLISSAPEMYEALKVIREEIPLMKYEQGLVDKAIAHAEGRELGTDSKVLKLGEGMMTIDLKEADKCDGEVEA
jgi:hypothetical protein